MTSIPLVRKPKKAKKPREAADRCEEPSQQLTVKADLDIDAMYDEEFQFPRTCLYQVSWCLSRLSCPFIHECRLQPPCQVWLPVHLTPILSCCSVPWTTKLPRPVHILLDPARPHLQKACKCIHECSSHGRSDHGSSCGVVWYLSRAVHSILPRDLIAFLLCRPR